MKILFMGTPDFAVPCLEAILQAGYSVAGVVTQPDKPKGRGHKLMPPPVKECARRHGIEVFQPESLRNEAFLPVLRRLSPDLIAVVAYGRILPKYILDFPNFGCVNVHASLLPRYRGAGPIQWSVINGETKTGVTTMYMAEGLDTGDMILKAETEIGPEETAGMLHDRLSVMGAELLAETLVRIADGSAPREPQEDALSCYAPMLDKKIAKLDFAQPATKLHDLIRGLSPWPVAHTTFEGKLLKVHRAVVAQAQGDCGPAGKVLDSKKLIVACGSGALELQQVQLEGGKRISGEDFMRGRKAQQLGE